MSTSSSDIQSAAEAASGRESSVRRQMAAAAGRIRRLKQVDRLAVGIITLGGLAVVISVIGILVFIAAEAVPLFRSSSATLMGTLKFGSPAVRVTPEMAALGADEASRYVYTVDPAGNIVFFNPESGALVLNHSVPSLTGKSVTATSRSLAHDFVAAGTNDGRVALLQVRFTPNHQDGVAAAIDVDVAERGLVTIDPEQRAVRRVADRKSVV